MADLDFVIGWSGSAASRGFRSLAQQAKETGTHFRSLKQAAETAGDALKKAQTNAAAATRKVAVEEAKLKELRDSGKAKLSQILAAEDRLANARRKEADATEEVERATKGLERAQGRLSETSSRSARVFGALDKGATVAGRGIGVAGKGLKLFGVAAAGLAVGGVAAISAVGAAGAVMGVKIASGNEQAKISFTTMLGSAKKADTFLRQLQKFAAETPFEFPELQTAASSLISAGINADKVIPIMRTLGDVTSGMGTGSEGVQRATIALQQMAAAGKITGEDLNQLRDAGIPVFDLLAAATGKSKSKIVELAQAGKLGKKELGQLMEALESGKGLERFSGLMEKQSKSLAGTWSTLKDTIGQGLAGVMDDSLPILKDGINTISSLAQRGFDWVDKNKDSIASLFKSAQVSIASFGRIANGVFQAFIGSTGDGTKSFKSFADWVATNQTTITAAFVNAGKAGLEFGRTLATSASTGLRAFAFLLDGITTATQGVLYAIGGMAAGATTAFGWVPGLGPKLKEATRKFNEFTKTAVDGARGAADGARGLADGIDKTLLPAIDRSSAALDKFGAKEISKAGQRDAAAKTALAIRGIGEAADGSQVKLKHFSDISKLSASEQGRLRKAMKDAGVALHDQLGGMQAAGASQGKLTSAWKKGRDAIYDQFRQMGIGKKEARNYAEALAGVPPKVRTDVVVAGAKVSAKEAKDLNAALKGIPKEQRARIVTIANTKGAKEARREIAKVKDRNAKINVSSDAKKETAKSNRETSKAKGKNTKINVSSDAKQETAKSNRETSKAKGKNTKINVSSNAKKATSDSNREVSKAKGKKGRDVDIKVDSNAKKTTTDSNRDVNKAKGKNVKIDVDSNARAVASAAQRAINSVHGKSVTITTYRETKEKKAFGGKIGEYWLAGGGRISSGTTSPRADDVPIMGSFGEWMIQRSSAEKYGDAKMSAVNAGTATILTGEGRAFGGPMVRTRFERPRTYERLAGAPMGGGPTIINVALSAPNYLGSPQDLKRTFETMARNGDLRRTFELAGRK